MSFLSLSTSGLNPFLIIPPSLTVKGGFSSIESSIKDKEDVTLPGLGVFFEVLWNNSDESSKDYILNTLKKSFE